MSHTPKGVWSRKAHAGVGFCVIPKPAERSGLMDEPVKTEKAEKNFLEKYIYGQGGKTLLTVFVIGAVLAILAPSVVSPAMVVIAVAITLVVQRFNKKS